VEVQDTPSESRESARWDPLALELQRLRSRAGEPSFAEIVRRICERRSAQGATPHAARVARTTVYDAFRTGRARVNVDLVRDITAVLGGSVTDIDTWISRCRDGRVDPAAQAGLPAEHADPVLPPDPMPQPEPAPLPPTGRRAALVLMAACLGLNLLGRMFVDLIELPVHLDMMGTAIAAIALGPWRGAAVGATTNLVGALVSGSDSIPFMFVNIAGALLWGYGVRRLGFGRTLPRFFALNVVVAFVCSLVAVPILVLLYGGTTHGGQDPITDNLVALTHQLTLAVGLANLLVSLADKIFSGFVALVLISALPATLRVGSCLVLATPGPPPPS